MDSKINQIKLYENTERFLKEKAVYNCIVKTVEEYSNGKVNTSDTFELFNKACNISLIDNLGHNYFRDIDKHIIDLTKVQNHISTGWKWMDDKLSGGFLIDGRALYVFCGITNVGKSIVLGNIATNCLAKNQTVVLISLEMPEEIYTKRIDTQLSKIPYNELTTQTGSLKDFVVNYQKTHNNSNLIIKEFPPSTIRVNTIKTYIEKLINKGIKPDIVIVDYLNLVLPNYKSDDTSYEKIKAVTEQIRALSYTFKIPWVSATQINRGGMKSGKSGKVPEMDSVSESIGISYTADAQIGIYQKDEDKEMGRIHFSIMKNRFGPAFGNICMKLDYKTLSITETDDITADSDNIDRVTQELNS
jgi:replicative DNA helicase